MSFYRNESVENPVRPKILGHRPVPLLLEKIGLQWLLERLKCRKNCRGLTQHPLTTTNLTVFIMMYWRAAVPSRDHLQVMRWAIYSVCSFYCSHRTVTTMILNLRQELQKKPTNLGLDLDFLTKSEEKSTNLKPTQSKTIMLVANNNQTSKEIRRRLCKRQGVPSFSWFSW